MVASLAYSYSDEDLLVPEQAHKSATASLEKPWIERLIPFRDRILALTKLPPDWDSYRGRATSSEAAQLVMELVSKLGPTFELPDLYPLPSGGVHLEWCSPAAEVSIECTASGLASLLVEASGELETETEVIPLTHLLMDNSLLLERRIPRAD